MSDYLQRLELQNVSMLDESVFGGFDQEASF